LPNRTPATQALLALPFGQNFAPFPGLPSHRQFEKFASKMLIYFQKRFGGVARLTAIWFDISNIFKTVAISQKDLMALIA
jgi:hypothetical protein